MFALLWLCFCNILFQLIIDIITLKNIKTVFLPIYYIYFHNIFVIEKQDIALLYLYQIYVCIMCHLICDSTVNIWYFPVTDG